MTISFFFVSAAEFYSSDSSDDEVPRLSDGTIQQEYGRNAACFFIKDNMLINIRIFLYDRDYNIHVCACFRVRVQATFALLWGHESDFAELSEPSGQQEVEKEIMALESPQTTKGMCDGRQIQGAV